MITEKEILIEYLSKNGFSKASAEIYVSSLANDPEQPTNLKFTSILEIINFALNQNNVAKIKEKDGIEEYISYNQTYDSFIEHTEGLDIFMKCMRTLGYFGKSPQLQYDLDKQQEMTDKLNEIKEFVKSYHKKYLAKE